MTIGVPWIGPVQAGTSAGTNTTTVTLDYSGAPVGEVVWCILTLSDTTTTIATPTGWTAYQQGDQTRAHIAVFWRVKVAGDTSVTVTWATSARTQGLCISWPGVDKTTPAEGWGFYPRSTTGSSFPVTATSTQADRVAVMVSVARGTAANNVWTPDPALTERLDIVNSTSAFLSLEIADSGTAAPAGSTTYTSNSSTLNNNGLAAVFFLIPVATAVTVNAKRYEAGGWVLYTAKPKVWTGSVWKAAAPKRWNGTSWVKL